MEHHHAHPIFSHDHLHAHANTGFLGDFAGIFNHTLSLVFLVLSMMLVVEFLNISTKGMLTQRFHKSRWLSYSVAVFLGVVPGCFGTFMAVTLFTHGILSPGALVATAIATSGDEAYVIFATSPQTFLLLNLFLVPLGFVFAFLTDFLFPKWMVQMPCDDLVVHGSEARIKIQDLLQMGRGGVGRTLILLSYILVAVLLVSGILGEIHGGNLMRWITIVAAMAGGIILLGAPDHFLYDHFWKHIFKAHFPRIFFWTFLTFLAVNLILKMDTTEVLSTHQGILILAAAALGILPESGPHLVFYNLYLAGKASFVVVVVSSIVQDGHGLIPLLAHSRRDFLGIKAVNVVAGLIVGWIGYLFFIP